MFPIFLSDKLYFLSGGWFVLHIYSRKGGLPSWSDCFFTDVKKGIFALFLRKEFYGIIVKQEGFIG